MAKANAVNGDDGSEPGYSAVGLAAPERERLGPILEALRGIVAETGSLPAERMVADRLQVKRHTLRRALELLRATGELTPARSGRRPLGESRASAGLASCTNPVEVIELRTVIEPPLARFAALRASPAEIARIRRAATTPPDVEPGSADLAFHRAVAMGSRNTLAAELYGLLRQVATDTRLRLGGAGASRRCPKRTAERDLEHAAIADAISRRDPDAAERAMRAHLEAVQRQIYSQFRPGVASA